MEDPLESILKHLPEVESEPWSGIVRHRVRGKTFLYSDTDSTQLKVKLDEIEAEAVCAYDDKVVAWDNSLGRDHGWVVITVSDDEPHERWEEIAEWIETSYCLLAPSSLCP